MLRKLRTIGAALGGALWLTQACSIKTPEDGNVAGSAVSSAGATATEAGGKSAKGGSSAQPTSRSGSGGKSAAGGEGDDSAPCPNCQSGFCLEDSTCVDCLPSNDHCPSGQYCTSDNEC